MSKQRVILFEGDFEPRIFTNPKNINELAKRGQILINPVMSGVRGVPLQYWKADFEKNVIYKDTVARIYAKRPKPTLKQNLVIKDLQKQVKYARLLAIILPAVYILFMELLHSGGLHACLELIKSYFRQF